MAGQPPPDLKGVIDKTASFVARLGATFEKRVFENERNNNKFSFLHATDPFYDYYQAKIKEFKANPEQGVLAGKPAPPPTASTPESAAQSTPEAKATAATVSKPATARPAPKAPAQDQFILPEHKKLSALDLDVIKLTAQFVARNGASFQVGMVNREHKNPQFDFLKPTDALYPFFNALVQQYARVLLPPRNIAEQLRSQYNSPHGVLNRLMERVDWENVQERMKRSEEEEAEAERVAFAMVDWHDFVVVETIDLFDEEEDLPPPITAEDLGQELNMQREMHVKEANEEAEMEIDEEEGPEVRPTGPQPSGQPSMQTSLPAPDLDKIKPQPPKAPKRSTLPVRTQLCPRCHQEIPVDEMEKHVRIELLDPQYRTHKTLITQRAKESTLAIDDDISHNLQNFAKKRTDIFGREELAIGQSIDDQSAPKKEKIAWDGHTSTAIRTANAAVSEQLSQNSVPIDMETDPVPVPMAPPMTGLQPPTPATTVIPPPMIPQPVLMQPIPMMVPPAVPFMRAPMMMNMSGIAPGMMPNGMPLHMNPALMSSNQVPEEPPAKRAKIEESIPSLIPEEIFFRDQPKADIIVQIQLPQLNGKGEWDLQGQMLPISINLKDTVFNVKNMIKEKTSVPVNKQKLSVPIVGFLKDQCTLAYYNIRDNTVLTLKLKERGGKKK